MGFSKAIRILHGKTKYFWDVSNIIHQRTGETEKLAGRPSAVGFFESFFDAALISYEKQTIWDISNIVQID